MSTSSLVPALILAQASSTPIPFSWAQALAQYGALGLWLLWFVVRDRSDREDRKLAIADQERRHADNIKVQKEQTKALNLMTQAMMLEVIATRHMDSSIKELADKLKEQAKDANAHDDHNEVATNRG